MNLKLATLIIALLIFSVFVSNAQCPGCSWNSCSAWLPDGGICDTVLNPAMQNHDYEDTISFYMPSPVSDPAAPCPVDLNTLTITSVVGLPIGLFWESNKSASSNNYYPSAGEHDGCVRICGIPRQSGVFAVSVHLLADVYVPCLSMTVLDQPYTYSTSIEVIADTSGGVSSFSISPFQTTSCGPISLDFEALFDNNPGNLTLWSWNFDNGNTSNLKNPPLQNFTGPGTYHIQLETRIYDYQITNVSVNSVSGAYCGDPEELLCGCGWLTQCPDPFIAIPEAGFNNESSSVSDVTSCSWSFSTSPIVLPNTGDTFHIQVYDDDVISANDFLGQQLLNYTIGTLHYSEPGGCSGDIVMDTSLNLIQRDTFVLTVYPVVSPPVLQASKDSFCGNDSSLLWISSSVDGLVIEWYKDSSIITSAVDSFYYTHDGGSYYVRVYDPLSGCEAYSDAIMQYMFPMPPSYIAISKVGPGILANTNFPSSGFSIQWFENGVAIPGDTNQLLNYPGDGTYSCIVYNRNKPDCFRASDAFIVSGIQAEVVSELKISPNPATDFLQLSFSGNESIEFKLRIFDMSGSSHTAILMTDSKGNKSLDIRHLRNGVYLLNLQSESYQRMVKFVKW